MTSIFSQLQNYKKKVREFNLILKNTERFIETHMCNLSKKKKLDTRQCS